MKSMVDECKGNNLLLNLLQYIRLSLVPHDFLKKSNGSDRRVRPIWEELS